MIPNLDWQDRAACVGLDSRVFYANGKYAREQVDTARKVCAACPVRIQCAAWAIQTGEKWGVWGGMSQKELRQKRVRDRAPRTSASGKPKRKAPEPAKCGTRSGYQKHLREKTAPCQPCRQANTDADNRLRRTGTTKAAA